MWTIEGEVLLLPVCCWRRALLMAGDVTEGRLFLLVLLIQPKYGRSDANRSRLAPSRHALGARAPSMIVPTL